MPGNIFIGSYSYGCSCHIVFLLQSSVNFAEIPDLSVSRPGVGIGCYLCLPRPDGWDKYDCSLSIWLEAAQINQGFLDHSSHPAGTSTAYHSRLTHPVAIGQTNGPHHYFRLQCGAFMSDRWIGGLNGAWCFVLPASASSKVRATRRFEPERAAWPVSLDACGR